MAHLTLTSKFAEDFIALLNGAFAPQTAQLRLDSAANTETPVTTTPKAKDGPAPAP